MKNHFEKLINKSEKRLVRLKEMGAPETIIKMELVHLEKLKLEQNKK